jgi:hypothetical protein
MTRSAKLFLGSALALVLTPGLALAAETYELKTADVKAVVGAKGKTSVIIAAKPGWKVNEEAPVSLKLKADDGVTVEKDKLTRKDLAEKTHDKARFDVAFTASAPGKKTIAAEANFVMCQATTCVPVKEKVVLAIDVAAK